MLSELEMPRVDGFELLDWMLKNTPQTPAFAMTAQWSASTRDKLASLGVVECFTKPLDVPAVMGRIDEVLAAGVRGHIQNMSTPSLLQIINMDRKTCTLLMSTRDKSGSLFIHKGEVVDARTGDLRGERAALSILSWPFPTITIDSRCDFTERTIDKPLTYIIMEAMRLADEQARLDEAAPVSSGALSKRGSIAPPSIERRAASDAPPRGADESIDVAASRIARTPLSMMRALALALVDAEGHILSAAVQAGADPVAMARLASRMLFELRAAQSRQAHVQPVEEIVFTASDSCHLVKPLPSRPDLFVLLAFNPRETSLATRRADLAELMQALEERGSPTGA